MKSGDRVIVCDNFSEYHGKTGIVLAVRPDYEPDVAVVFDGDDRVPELAMRYLWSSSLRVCSELG